MKRILTILYTFILVLFLQQLLYSQWDNRQVIFPEDTISNAFKAPNNYFLSGFAWDDTVQANITRVNIWVARTASSNFVPLVYDGAYYQESVIDSVPKAVTFKFTRTFAWEWWKLSVDAALRDSVYIYPQYTEFKD